MHLKFSVYHSDHQPRLSDGDFGQQHFGDGGTHEQNSKQVCHEHPLVDKALVSVSEYVDIWILPSDTETSAATPWELMRKK